MNALHPLPSVATAVAIPSAPATEKPEAAALAVLKSSVDLHEKARACQELGTVGGLASVPALAALLGAEHLADYARSGLENIGDPTAGKTLREALPRLEGRYLAGAVNSLGVRREKSAVAELRALALDAKRGVAEEAIASLGMIGTPDAAKILEEVLSRGPANLRLPTVHAALVAAEHLTQEKNRGVARRLLEAVVRAQPPEHIITVAKNQSAKLARI